MFVGYLLATSFSNILQFWGPFRVQFGSLFGVPGNFGNGAKTLKRRYFHTLEVLVAGMISGPDLVVDDLSIFLFVDGFWHQFRECFGTNM